MSKYTFASKIEPVTGRFVIPRKLLKELGWTELSRVEVEADIEDNKLIIKKPLDQTVKNCESCGAVIKVDYLYCPYCGESVK